MCGQNVKIKLIDYKVVIYPCVNGHKDKILFLKDYDYFQNLFFSKKLKCDICNENDIKYFYCYNCKNKLCSSCKENTKMIIALLIMKILIIFVLNIKSLLILIAKKVSKICVLHVLKLIMPMKIFYMKKYH